MLARASEADMSLPIADSSRLVAAYTTIDYDSTAGSMTTSVLLAAYTTTSVLLAAYMRSTRRLYLSTEHA
eukprot:2022313-Rhodomonas_salina.1